MNKSFFEIFFTFAREENLRNNIITSKIYTIFPNVNFELRQIKNWSFSNTQLNKYLVSKTYQMDNNSFDATKLKNGFFTMSQEHRWIALRDDTSDNGDLKNSKSWKQIIVGIWLNFKEESPRPKQLEWDELLEKHKFEIYSKCFEFVELTEKMDSVYSPSPDQGVFLLVLFYHGMQCHYEVKLYPNEEERLPNNPEQPKLNNFGNNWWILKNKQHISINETLSLHLGNEIANGSVITLSAYWTKKTGLSQKSFLTRSNNTKQATSKPTSGVNNFRDNLQELFDSSNSEIYDDMDDFYNYPWIMQNKTESGKESNSCREKNETEKYGNSKDNKKSGNEKEKTFPMANSQVYTNNIYNLNPSSNINTNTNKGQHISNSQTNNKKNKGISLLSSLNSQKTMNNTNVNTNYTINSIPGNYTAMIWEQSESIKKLQSQVTQLESNIKTVLDSLWKKKMKEHEKLKSKAKENENKNEVKNEDSKRTNKDNVVNKCGEQCALPDTSVKIPKIVWQESIMTFDEDESMH